MVLASWMLVRCLPWPGVGDRLREGMGFFGEGGEGAMTSVHSHSRLPKKILASPSPSVSTFIPEPVPETNRIKRFILDHVALDVTGRSMGEIIEQMRKEAFDVPMTQPDPVQPGSQRPPSESVPRSEVSSSGSAPKPPGKKRGGLSSLERHLR